MRKINGISLALVAMPLLFLGCTQEKMSTIDPLKSTNKKTLLNLDKSNQTPTQKNNQTTPKISIRDTTNDIAKIYRKKSPSESVIPMAKTYALEDTSILDELISSIDESILEQSNTQPIDIGEDWQKSAKEDKILETAQEFLGTKYIWAANGPTAFDCSGFTKYVFKKNGIKLPRHSGNQALIGDKIKFDNLQKGDLVFFDTTKKFKHIVNHVGIYLGNHQFIHASSGGKKVMITSFDEKKFYKNKFLFARRVINSSSNLALLSQK